MSPSGAVRAGPPAAQANRTVNFNAHEYTLCGKTGGVSVVLHPAKNRTRSWAGFPHGYVIVLDGRQPACVLCLALRKSRSKPKSAF